MHRFDGVTAPVIAIVRPTVKGIMRRGASLIELVVVLAAIGVLCAIGASRLLRHLDRTHVRHATDEIVAMLATARTTAVAREIHVTARFEAARSVVTVIAGADTIAMRAIGDLHGVRLRSNRDSTVYGPTGLGYGAANQTLVLERGRAIDSIVISRLGRVRR